MCLPAFLPPDHGGGAVRASFGLSMNKKKRIKKLEIEMHQLKAEVVRLREHIEVMKICRDLRAWMRAHR